MLGLRQVGDPRQFAGVLLALANLSVCFSLLVLDLPRGSSNIWRLNMT